MTTGPEPSYIVISANEFIDHHEANVVARLVVSSAWISQAHQKMSDLHST